MVESAEANACPGGGECVDKCEGEPKRGAGKSSPESPTVPKI